MTPIASKDLAHTLSIPIAGGAAAAGGGIDVALSALSLQTPVDERIIRMLILPISSVPVTSGIERPINTSLKDSSESQKNALKTFILSNCAAAHLPSAESKDSLFASIMALPSIHEIDGLCLGHSWMFGVFITEFAKISKDFSADNILQSYIQSNFFQQATPFTFLAYMELDQMLQITDGEVCVKEVDAELKIYKKLPSLKRFVNEYLGAEKVMAYPYIEELTPYLEKREPVVARIKELISLCDIESIEDPIPLKEKLEALEERSSEQEKLLELLRLVVSEMPVLELFAEIDERHLAKSKIYESIKNWATIHDEKACVLNFSCDSSDDELMGHATCFYVDKKQGVYIYLDSNAGLKCFPDVDSMSVYISKTLRRDYGASKIACSFIGNK